MLSPAQGPELDVVEPEPEVLLAHLRGYGYRLADATSWQPQPQSADGGTEQSVGAVLELAVTGHEELEGHTWYVLKCSLGAPGARRLQWSVKRRLAQLREGLHDPVKFALGNAYGQQLGAVPFAHKGGLPGTTARLRGWLGALAAAINVGGCPPSLVWLALHFLEVPAPPCISGDLKASASAAADRFRGAVSAAKGAVKQRVDQAHTQAAERASASAVDFAKAHPKVAQAVSGSALGYAKDNPQAAQAAGQFGAKTAFSCIRQNPKAAMSVLKVSARAAAARS